MTIEELRKRFADLTATAVEAQGRIEASESPVEADVTAFDEATAAADAVVAQIDAAETRSAKIEEYRKRAAENDRMGTQMRMPHTDPANKRHRYDPMKAIRSQVTGERLDGLEAESHVELLRERTQETKGVLIPHDVMIRTRALDMTTGAGVVGQAIMLPIVEALRARIVLTTIGMRIVPASGKFKLPRASKGTVYHVDGASPTAADRGADSVAFDLHTIAGKTKIQRKLLLSSDIDVQSYVWDTLISDIAGGIQVGCLTGTGADGEPEGLFKKTTGVSIKDLGTNGAVIDYAGILSMTAAVNTANAVLGQAFLMSEKGAAKLEGTPKVSGQPVYILNPETGTCAGRRYLSTSAVPDNLTKGTATAKCSGLAFGAWEYAVLALFSGIDVFVNPYSDDGGVTLSAFQDYDWNLTRPEAFSICKDYLAD